MQGQPIHTPFRFLGRCCAAWLLLTAPLFAETPEQTYDKQIKPLFAAKCFDCHSAKADDLKGGLKLDTLDDALRGGASGKTVLPGDVENSFLLRAVRYQEDDFQMPPSGKLPAADIERLEKWVRELQEATKR